MSNPSNSIESSTPDNGDFIQRNNSQSQTTSIAARRERLLKWSALTQREAPKI
jgi:hypothetical protein